MSLRSISALGTFCYPVTTVLDSTPAATFSSFEVNHILSNDCETGPIESTYYITPEGLTDAFITLDIGCQMFMTNIEIRNTRNRFYGPE